MHKLPEMYHNRIDKIINNNEKYYTTIDNTTKEDTSIKMSNDNYTIQQKIYNIFNSPNYIYKIDVTIVMDDGKVDKRIVGKTSTNLITMDGEYIPINKIRDIYITR